MKICHIVPSLEARYGGPSKSVLGLARAMADGGDEVELLATDPGAGWERDDGDLKIRVFHRDWPSALCPSRAMRSYLSSSQADVFHHHSIWLRTLHYCHVAARRRDALFIVAPRGMMDPWAWNHHSRRKAFARAAIHPGALEAVDGWHVTSASEEIDVRMLGFKQPVCVSPNGVVAMTAEESAAAAKHWNEFDAQTKQRRVALFYSRFHQKKRLLELIDAWLELGPSDWVLLVVGIQEQYTARMIDGYVLRSGGAGRVRAYDGSSHPVPYPIASLFLLPSHGENFGLSIAEALANGVPALVTDATPWAELNRNGGGWCVPWADFGRTLAEATAESPESLGRRGAVAREWVLREFSWAHSARLLTGFYGGLLARA